MSFLLAIDVGNTHVVLGVFHREELKARWRITSDLNRTADEYGLELIALLASENFPRQQIDSIAICCVVPPLARVFAKIAAKYFGVHPFLVNADCDLGIIVACDDPASVGPDRLVNAVAATKFVGLPAIVVDFGTATTFDVIAADGSYQGGAIAPGINISAQALFHKAAMLYSIELKKPTRAIGRNTKDSMLSGIVFGYVGLVDGIIARIIDEMGVRPRVVATGGLAAVVSSESQYIEEVIPDLTLKGLRIIASSRVASENPDSLHESTLD